MWQKWCGWVKETFKRREKGELMREAILERGEEMALHYHGSALVWRSGEKLYKGR